MIIGAFGFQRSGKTAIAVFLARFFEQYGHKIYSNIEGQNIIQIDKISDVPLDGEPKTLIFDEAYYYLDSRNFAKNMDFTLFINTLGKQRVLLIITAITPDQIDLRLRNQMSTIILAKGNDNQMIYKIIDVVRGFESATIALPKNQKIFNYLNYNSDLVVPNKIVCDLDKWSQMQQKY